MKPAIVRYKGAKSNEFVRGKLYEAFFWNIGKERETVCMFEVKTER